MGGEWGLTGRGSDGLLGRTLPALVTRRLPAVKSVRRGQLGVWSVMPCWSVQTMIVRSSSLVLADVFQFGYKGQPLPGSWSNDIRILQLFLLPIRPNHHVPAPPILTPPSMDPSVHSYVAHCGRESAWSAAERNRPATSWKETLPPLVHGGIRGGSNDSTSSWSLTSTSGRRPRVHQSCTEDSFSGFVASAVMQRGRLAT